MNGRFPIAIHIMTLLCTTDDVLSSAYIAGSINVNPVIVRKELSNLIKHGLVESREGKKGGYRLSQPAKNIKLSDIYSIVKPESILGMAKNTPNPDCNVGKQITEHLNELYEDVEASVIQKLDRINLLAFCNRFN